MRSSFTLIELLLIIGIIAVLALAVVFALYPRTEGSGDRDAQRKADVTLILNALYAYSIDKDTLPEGITSAPKGICQTGAKSCVNGVDLSPLTASGKYLVRVPVDPAVTSGTGANYTVVQAGGRITVSAPGAEGGSPIGAVH